MPVPLPVPPWIAGKAAMIAALLGCAVVLGMGREAGASVCHVDDRPVFGLSEHSAEPEGSEEGGEAIAGADGPIRLDPRCPAEDPERPSLRVALSGELPMLDAAPAEEPEAGRPIRPVGEPSRPIRRMTRIERPPRSR